MVKAGPAVDAVLEELAGHLDEGDLLIDGGNSYYEDTVRREQEMAERGLRFLGTGVSGGEEGALNGPSIMPGGDAEAYAMVEQLFTTIAAQVDGTPCCRLVGPGGAGHYVKMVHNGIEYADMQLIAEAYDLLGQGAGMAAAELAEVFEALEPGRPGLVPDRDHRQGAAPGRPGQRPAAGRRDPGPGRAEGHRPLDRPVGPGAGRAGHRDHRGGVRQGPVVTARAAHGRGQGPALGRRAGWRPTGPKRSSTTSATPCTPPRWSPTPRGSSRSRPPPTPYGWEVELGGLATIWRGGCIIRARFLDRIREAYAADPGLRNLLFAEYFRDAVGQAQDAWRRVGAAAVTLGVPTPAFASSLAYYDGFRRERGPANLLQAQRDFFGAHTYRRTDRPGSFHTRWSEDGQEVEV